jgi:SAM-dependent methyltransferase
MHAGSFQSKWEDPERIRRMDDPKRFEEIPPQMIADLVLPLAPGTVVDIGAGSGLFSRRFLQYPGVDRVYACDISRAAVRWLTEKPAEGLFPVRMDSDAVPLESGIAGLVCFINVLHELKDPRILLAEAFRLLAPGGKICIADWRKEAEAGFGPDPQDRSSSEHTAELLLQAGFSAVSLSESLKHHYLAAALKNPLLG